MSKAQKVLLEDSSKAFKAWLQTKAGKAWKRGRYRKQRSPYSYGFHMSPEHHALIKALGEGDEHQAKSLMLHHFLPKPKKRQR